MRPAIYLCVLLTGCVPYIFSPEGLFTERLRMDRKACTYETRKEPADYPDCMRGKGYREKDIGVAGY